MNDTPRPFGVNTYSYTQRWTAEDCVRRLAEQGYAGVELMMYPGHLWPAEADATRRRALRRLCETSGLRLVTINSPNIDLNVAAACREMREHTLGLNTAFLRLSGELGAAGLVLGPGKANPLFPAPREQLLGYFYEALDRLSPVAREMGASIFVENMPFCFIADAQGIMHELERRGDPEIGVVYDVANAHFIGEDPRDGLRIVRERLKLVHYSDTTRAVYRHDPVGAGDTPFDGIPEVLAELGFREMPMLEVISQGDADAEIRDSVARLTALGFASHPVL
jgi:L-ribulose-5-phosphate 3-epimerase